jgi:hypothetical protein
MIPKTERIDLPQDATLIAQLMDKWAMNRQSVVRTLKETSRFHGLSVKEAAVLGTQDRFFLTTASGCGELAA